MNSFKISVLFTDKSEIKKVKRFLALLTEPDGKKKLSKNKYIKDLIAKDMTCRGVELFQKINYCELEKNLNVIADKIGQTVAKEILQELSSIKELLTHQIQEQMAIKPDKNPESVSTEALPANNRMKPENDDEFAYLKKMKNKQMNLAKVK